MSESFPHEKDLIERSEKGWGAFTRATTVTVVITALILIAMAATLT